MWSKGYCKVECCYRKLECGTCILKSVIYRNGKLGAGSFHCECGSPCSLADTGYGETIKCILIENIHKFGNLYARYQNIL